MKFFKIIETYLIYFQLFHSDLSLFYHIRFILLFSQYCFYKLLIVTMFILNKTMAKRYTKIWIKKERERVRERERERDKDRDKERERE